MLPRPIALRAYRESLEEPMLGSGVELAAMLVSQEELFQQACSGCGVHVRRLPAGAGLAATD